MAPIENKTSAGTPLATQNAPCQPIFLCNVSVACPACEADKVFALNLCPLFLKFSSPALFITLSKVQSQKYLRILTCSQV